MLRKIILSISLGCLIVTGNAQIKWPPVTQETKPWGRWWWMGSAVNKKDLTANMEEYKAAGLGGLEVTPIYGAYGYEKQFIDFLSPQWMQMLDHTLKEAKRLGLGIDLANGTGWPFGGPTITDKYASKTVEYKSYELKEGEELQEPIIFKQEGFVRTANNKPLQPADVQPVIAENKDLQAFALDQVKFAGALPLQVLMAYSDKGSVVNLTDKVNSKGKLSWKAPVGNWKLFALFVGLHGKMVERAAPGGEGYAIDHFSAEALQHYFKRFNDAFKGHDLSYIRALFNDSYEVDDARGQSNWTPKLFEEFTTRRGYDLKNYLPALFQKADDETNSRILYDYRTTIGELILEDFTQEWKKWGTTKGATIRNQSHGSPANLLDLYAAIDIPETEGDDILRFKFATSAAHVTGKRLASSESATWLNEHFLSSWADVKKALDLFILGGVNHIFYHGVNYSPKNEQWPGWLFYAAVHFQQTNPQWKDFHALNTYVTRAQSFLQTGKPDNDILVYYPLADRYSIPEKEMLQHFDGIGREFKGTDFEKVSEWMQEHGYSFDFFSDKQLQNFTSAGKGLISGGNNYQAILLPANKFITERSFRKLVDLAKNGAQILVYKSLPGDVPGYGRLTERRSLFQNLLKQLKFIEGEGIRKASIGKGSFIIADDMKALLKAGRIRVETLPGGLQSIRRKNIEGLTYFIANRSNKEINEWVPLSAKAASAALFNPMTGKSGLANYKTTGEEKVEVMIQLQPYESTIVQLYNSKKTGNKFQYIQTSKKEQELKGNWTIAFIKGGPVLPATVTTSQLGSWTGHEGETYKHFSGSAKYSLSFARPAGNANGWLLDLGKVNETAEVFLNGKKLATLIGPSFHVVIPAAELKETNALEIVVSNLMANRIIYMDKNNIPWKKFYNINMSARKRENVKDGIFDASAWEPLPSGLLGPVTIAPLK
ncbi:MAG: glycoside hydrolase family 2 protein [Segetibacter sp.]|nr:glycoside hydrolase family 2 protein [Segetibacter sp.]